MEKYLYSMKTQYVRFKMQNCLIILKSAVIYSYAPEAGTIYWPFIGYKFAIHVNPLFSNIKYDNYNNPFSMLVTVYEFQ